MADGSTNVRSTKIFISYSRKDKAFVRKLNDALDAAGIDAWVDWEGIPLSSDWMVEITQAIEGADAFLFVISPDSLASKVCAQELELGLSLNKKLVPILFCEPERGTEMHPKLGATNWVYLREEKDDFDSTLPRLVEAIQTDLGWVKQHTRLLQRATEWDHRNRNNSYLLNGTDLDEGEKWMTESAAGENRNVLPLQAEYISTSRKVAIKRQRSLMTGIALAFVVSVVLGIFALLQRNQSVLNEQIARTQEAAAIANANLAATQQTRAEQEQVRAEENARRAEASENIAKAQRSAAQANIYRSRPGEMDTSTLLALDSWQRFPSQEAEDILRNNISFMPVPVAQMDHAGIVANIHPSVDGKLLVTSSEDGSACVWEMQNGASKYCVKHESGEVLDAFLSADNSFLITGGSDGTVRFWNGSDGSAAEVLELKSKVWDIDISKDNLWVAAGREDGVITLINLTSRTEMVSFGLNIGEIFTVNFDPTSKWLVIGSSNGGVRVWGINTAVSYPGPRHTSEVYAIGFSADGAWMVSVGADSTARITKTLAGGQKQALVHGDWVEDVAFGPDSSWFVTASDDNLVRVWDTETGVEKLRMEHGGFVLRVEVSPNGQWIASSSFDRTVRIWDAASGSLMKEISLAGQGSSLAFSPDGNFLITGDRAGHVGIWDISDLNTRAGYLVFPELVRKAKFNSTGEWTMFNSDDKKVWQIPTSQLTSLHNGTEGTAVVDLEGISSQFKISPDSKWIVISETYGKRAILHNLETGAEFSLPLDADVSGLAFSADNRLVATTYDKGTKVIVWNVETGEKLKEIEFNQTAYTISFDPRDNSLAVGLDNKIILWDVDANAESATLNQVGEIRSLNYSREGDWLATTSSEGSIFLWDMTSDDLTEPRYALLQGGNITSLDFSHDSRWLASGGGNGFAYLWDLSSGEEYARLPHSNAVTSVSFSSDSKLLMTVSRKTVQIWNTEAIRPVSSDSIIETACSHLTENMSETDWLIFFSDEEYRPICPEPFIAGQ